MENNSKRAAHYEKVWTSKLRVFSLPASQTQEELRNVTWVLKAKEKSSPNSAKTIIHVTHIYSLGKIKAPSRGLGATILQVCVALSGCGSSSQLLSCCCDCEALQEIMDKKMGVGFLCLWSHWAQIISDFSHELDTNSNWVVIKHLNFSFCERQFLDPFISDAFLQAYGSLSRKIALHFNQCNSPNMSLFDINLSSKKSTRQRVWIKDTAVLRGAGL